MESSYYTEVFFRERNDRKKLLFNLEKGFKDLLGSAKELDKATNNTDGENTKNVAAYLYLWLVCERPKNLRKPNFGENFDRLSDFLKKHLDKNNSFLINLNQEKAIEYIKNNYNKEHARDVDSSNVNLLESFKTPSQATEE